MVRIVAVLATTLLLLVGSASAAESSYSQQIAMDHVYLAYGAYCPVNELKAWTCKWCQKLAAEGYNLIGVNSDDKAETLAFIAQHNTTSEVVVSVRGTISVTNWIENLDFKLTHWDQLPGGPQETQVHAGFLYMWQTQRQFVLDTIAPLMANKDAYIFATGHSSGAATSAILVVELANLYPGRVTQYNYGQPRVGTSVYDDFVRANVTTNFRVTNLKDPVPHIPPMWIDGYKHTGTEVWYTDDSPLKYKVCDGSGEDKSCSDGQINLDFQDHLYYFGIPNSC